MNEAKLKALTARLIAECSPETLSALEGVLRDAQTDPSGAALGDVLTVATVAREVIEDRAARATAPGKQPGTLGEALALDAAQGRR